MLTFCGLTTDGMYEYLAAIYKLGCDGDKVTTSALAETMHVTPAAASSMLKRLEESGFVERSSLQGIVLREQGRSRRDFAEFHAIVCFRKVAPHRNDAMMFEQDERGTSGYRLCDTIRKGL